MPAKFGIIGILSKKSKDAKKPNDAKLSSPLKHGILCQKSFRFHNKVKLECNRHRVTSHGQALLDHAHIKPCDAIGVAQSDAVRLWALRLSLQCNAKGRHGGQPLHEIKQRAGPATCDTDRRDQAVERPQEVMFTVLDQG